MLLKCHHIENLLQINLIKKNDKIKESIYLMYFFENSLWSCAMCNPLPYRRFGRKNANQRGPYMKRMLYEKQKFVTQNIQIIYTTLHNDYPLAPEKIVIDDVVEMFPYRKNYTKIPKSNVPKLVTSFLTKKGYVIKVLFRIRFKNKITKILTFKEKPWMKKFIEFNI